MRKKLLIVMPIAYLLLIPALGPQSAPVFEPTGVLTAGNPSILLAQEPQQPEKEVKVDINVNRGGRWYLSPIWIAIGVIGLLLLILLIVMAVRGGGTTVVRG